MSRSGFHEMDDFDVESILATGRTQGRIASASRGRRGQHFFKSALKALDRMQDKRLAGFTFGVSDQGCMCLMSSLATETGRASVMTGLNRGDDEAIRDRMASAFDVAPVLISDLVFVNDECAPRDPAKRWAYMRNVIAARIKGAS